MSPHPAGSDSIGEAGDGSAPPGEVRLPLARLLQNWKTAHARARSYLHALGFAGDERDRLAERAVARAARVPWGGETHSVAETLRALRALLREAAPADAPGGRCIDDFVAWRLASRAPAGHRTTSRATSPTASPNGRAFGSMPPLTRGTFTGQRFVGRGLRRRVMTRAAAPGAAPANGTPRTRAASPARPARPWARAATRRRLFLGALVLIPSGIASGFMLDVLPRQGETLLETAIVVCFGVLFGWISIGFWTAVAGFVTQLRRHAKFRITDLPDEAAMRPIGPEVRTAIVMPICEEPVARVFGGLRAIYRSVERTGALDHFDFFVLSDTSDPQTWIEEEEAWFEWCRAIGRFDKVYYRRRRSRVERKSGNIADFCRRWGRAYRYMVVLDADSLMAGPTVARLVALMEAHDNVGLIQTVPVSVNRRSLFARVQQFASRVYGPLFAAGMHFWQLGEGHYWGHNAIIRIAPFMEHCGLPRLPGKQPLGGEILSHDFVEAALLGRAGWAIWLAYDLPGSYEEPPSSLLEELKRDRRWCQGNLQHLRLLFTAELYGAHRALFLNGVLAYVSALLWFCLLSLSTILAIREAVREPDYFPAGRSLYPDWPLWRPDWALWLLAVTAAILFLPKVLSVVLVLVRERTARGFGGTVRFCASVVLEILISSLLAPIRMVFHTKFVLTNLLGRTVSWRSTERGDAETTWREAVRHHGPSTLVASAWGLAVYWLSPDYFWWLTPVVAALLIAVPLSVLASRVGLGELARRHRLFLTPEEESPPPELQDLATSMEEGSAVPGAAQPLAGDSFVRAVVDPVVNALHCGLLGPSRSLRPRIRDARRALVERGLREGPSALQTRDRRAILFDPDLLCAMHYEVWSLDDPERARAWGVAELPPGA
jgi:membrane glycosyltransferase